MPKENVHGGSLVSKETVREVTYEAEALVTWLRSLLVDLNKGDVAAAKTDIRDAISKIESQRPKTKRRT
jgi:hypothetical protein